ncbi:selenocysteine-tRNA-specific elongation factor [Trypanosoma cruzi]|nr:selenocysteine-tRNA-specific elongation factor [Trypanosoma cruzi]
MDAQVQVAFDGLVSCRRALEIARDPTDQLMDFGRALLRTFRMQIMMASDPGIPLPKLRDRLHMAVHGADTFARATQPLVSRRATQQQQQRLLRCRLCRICGHDASACNVRSAARRNDLQHGRPPKNGEGLPAAYEGGRMQPHPFLYGVAPHRRCSARSLKLPDAIVDKGSGAYPPTTLDCGTKNHRHLRFGPAI